MDISELWSYIRSNEHQPADGKKWRANDTVSKAPQALVGQEGQKPNPVVASSDPPADQSKTGLEKMLTALGLGEPVY